MSRSRLHPALPSWLCGAAALAVCLSGCGHPVQRRLEGRWFGQSVENVPRDQIATTTAWARGTTLEFSGAHLTITVPEHSPRSAPFDVVEATPHEATLALKGPDGDVSRARFSLDDEDLVRWHVTERQAVVLRRGR